MFSPKSLGNTGAFSSSLRVSPANVLRASWRDRARTCPELRGPVASAHSCPSFMPAADVAHACAIAAHAHDAAGVLSRPSVTEPTAPAWPESALASDRVPPGLPFPTRPRGQTQPVPAPAWPGLGILSSAGIALPVSFSVPPNPRLAACRAFSKNMSRFHGCAGAPRERRART